MLAVPLGSWTVLRWLLVTLALISLTLDTARVASPNIGRSLQRLVPVFRETEMRRLSGASWLMLGYALAAWFPPPAPAAGVLVAATADPAASLIGTMGGIPGKKTWRGSAAGALVAALVLVCLGLPWIAVILAAVAAAVFERWSGILDDNLIIAPAVALAIWLLT